MKLIIVITLALLLFDCGKRKPLPLPNPTPSPTVLPTPEVSPTPVASPSPSPRPSPIPTPNIDTSIFIKRASSYTKVSAINGLLSAPLNQAMKDPTIEGIELVGGGSITTNVIVTKPLKFDSSTYSCDVTQAGAIYPDIPATDYGCFIIADGVTVEGTYRIPKEVEDFFKFGDGNNPNDPYLLSVQALTAEQLAGTGTTILEPTFFIEIVAGITYWPAITVFQSLGDACCSHTGKAKDISVIGIRVKSRQTKYDGGVRSTIQLGNVENSLVSDIYLDNTGSIGVNFGGSAIETGNHAKNVVATRIITDGVGAANIAMVNTADGYAFNNYARRLGHHNPKFGGGVCGFDLETNSGADFSSNIWVYNNLVDFEDANDDGAGSAFVLQDPYRGLNRGKVTLINNWAIGGRNEPVRRYMSNGIFLNGLLNCYIANNYIFKTGQNAIQGYNVTGCIIEDNIFDSVGGGGSSAFWTSNMQKSIVRRNNYIIRPEGVLFNIQAGFQDICGTDNVFEDNLLLGKIIGVLKECPTIEGDF